MKLLLSRDQSFGLIGTKFTLWAKIEIDDDERAIIQRYKFDKARLMGVNDPNLLRKSALYGSFVFLAVWFLVDLVIDTQAAAFTGIFMGVLFAFWYFNEFRAQIYVRDLLYGRHYDCRDIIDLTKTEAQITNVTAIFRQVMESAIHWGGTETQDVPVLSKEEARALLLKVF
mgnify:CR=1 FL=1